MLMHPRPKPKLTFWELVKSVFTPQKAEQVPVVDPGKKLPKEAENPDRKATVFPGSGDF